MDIFIQNTEDFDVSKLCRCCVKNNGIKDVKTEYYTSGDREVYQEIIENVLGVQLPIFESSDLEMPSLICDECVLRLRGAAALKHTIIHSQELLRTYLKNVQNNENEKNTPKDLLDDVKTESSLGQEDDFENGMDESFENEVLFSNIKLEGSEVSDVTKINYKQRLKSTTKRNDNPQKDWSKVVERRGDGPLLRENSLKLISNSTLCVFQWNKSRYRCFCCKEPFSDIDLLRKHTDDNHSIQNIEKKIIHQQNKLVKVEISKLFCKICEMQMDSLPNLRRHLVEMHAILFTSNEDLLVPFKIQNELKCQICDEKFSVFRLLNIHINKHYQKHVCHICGIGFSNLSFLNLHKSRAHRPLKCKQCDAVFETKIDKRKHEVNLHGLKNERKLRFPCPYCDERFYQENFRVLHLVEKHGFVKPEHKCLICTKVFVTRSLLNNHTKNVHNKEKNHKCDVCHYLFYTKSDLSRHKVTHTGEKKFCCSLCNSHFSTKDSLRRHTRRAHAI